MFKKVEKGKVYLVGAGPGDPGLITVRGKDCLEAGDVVIYDHLASKRLLNYVPGRAELVYVGKKEGSHTLPQAEINALIVKKAKEGKSVIRLKGGDPFVFGRGGEEAEVLLQEGVPFEIVSGVTSAVAAPAYAGIPLTHRKYTSTFAIVTGHEDPNKEDSKIDWAALTKGIGSIVFLMGVKNIVKITGKLIENGRAPDTPVAVVRWGTTSRQITVTGTLGNIVERVEKEKIKPPAVIVVGDVVHLRGNLKWFEDRRPLLGTRIIVTRARRQASELVDRLSLLGGECVECPTIEVFPPEDYTPLDRAIEKISSYDWLVFTSVNGVEFFFNRLYEKGMDTRALGGLKTASVGPATSRALYRFGIKSDIVPESYRGEAVADAFKNEDVKDKKILLPRAKEARPVLPEELSKMGAAVDEIASYSTRQGEADAVFLLELLEEGNIDMVTFTSSSTVRNFKAMLPPERAGELMESLVVASIGPVTSDTARELGFNVEVTADSYTIPGLCKAILEYYGTKDSS